MIPSPQIVEMVGRFGFDLVRNFVRFGSVGILG
jgi:hypothetical protein